VSFLHPDANKEIERGPWLFDVLAVAFVPMGISRIGPADAVPAEQSTSALIGLGLVVAAFIGTSIYAARTKNGPDEWVTRNWERACAAAVLAALASDLLWRLAVDAHLIRPMSGNDLLGIQLIALGVAWLWHRWRSWR